jgi:hypothetical protein
VRLASPQYAYYFEIVSRAQGLLGLNWDINGPYAGILFLDKLVEKSPDAMVAFYGDGPCSRKSVPLIFFEGEYDEDNSFGLFDDSRPMIFDSFFPYFGLISEQKGFLCLDFTISGEPKEDILI